MPTETRIERAEAQRDLKAQITANQGLDREEEQGIIFKETSPKRRKTTIYHMRNGQPAHVPEYIATKALDKIDPETREYMFTAFKDKAPAYKLGTILCFLHADSPDQPILEELGLTATPCRKHTLANMHAKRMHAKNRHHDEWEAYQALMAEKQQQEDRAAQRAQLEATLALAGKVAGATSVETITCPDCDYTGTSVQLRGHKKVHNKAEAATVS